MKDLTLEEFADRFVGILPRLMQEIAAYQSNYIKSGQITLTQLIFLEYLSNHDQCQMHELVNALYVSSPNATGMLDRLVKEKLAIRRRGDEDRRAVFVSITAKGRKILKEIYAKKKKGILKLFSRISPQERATYLEIIEKLVKNLAEVPQNA
jgi:DNA-binding MarR family transcriptional regulator